MAFKFLANGIRGVDSTGIDQYTTTVITNTMGADIAATSAGKLTISLNANSPKTGFVVGNKTATTPDVKIADFDFKATDQDVTIKALKVRITESKADILESAVKLYDGATLLASVAGPGNGADASFTNLSILVAKDTTKTLTVKVDLKPIDGTTIEEESTIKATITATDTNISAVDSNDTLLTNTEITGTTDGKLITVYTKAPILTFVSSSITKTVQAGQADQADATIVFDVTATGGDIYIDKASHVLATITVDDGVADVDNFDGTVRGTYTFTSNAESGSATSYLIRSGQTARFTVSGHIINKDSTGYLHMAIDTLI